MTQHLRTVSVPPNCSRYRTVKLLLTNACCVVRVRELTTWRIGNAEIGASALACKHAVRHTMHCLRSTASTQQPSPVKGRERWRQQLWCHSGKQNLFAKRFARCRQPVATSTRPDHFEVAAAVKNESGRMCLQCSQNCIWVALHDVLVVLNDCVQR